MSDVCAKDKWRELLASRLTNARIKKMAEAITPPYDDTKCTNLAITQAVSAAVVMAILGSGPNDEDAIAIWEAFLPTLVNTLDFVGMAVQAEQEGVSPSTKEPLN